MWQQLPWYGQLALTILSEWRQGSASKWADYIKQLPEAVDVPALWSDAELQQLRCGYFIEQVWLRACHCSCFSPMSCSSGSSGAILLWGMIGVLLRSKACLRGAAVSKTVKSNAVK